MLPLRLASAPVRALLAGLLFALVLVLVPQQADAAEISRVRVAAISTKAFRVTLDSLGQGWTYTLYASTKKEQVEYAHLPTAPYRVSSKTPDLTLHDLPTTTAPYWFRLQATRASSHHTSDFFSVGLRPAAPQSLRAVRAERGAVRLSWTGKAQKFEVQQATNAAFTAGARTYRISLGAQQLTPYGMKPGVHYWFRVRGVNATSAGAYSSAVSAAATTSERTVRAMTFNMLTLSSDGSRAFADSEAVAPWSQRRVAAAHAISSASPAVVGLQEGGAYVGADPGPRQVDSLIDALGGNYALARTEIPPPQRGYYRVGSYIAFRPDIVEAVGNGGSWDLGAAGPFHKWAVYQELRDRSTGATFLFVSAHLLADGGADADVVRRDETKVLTTQARAYASGHGGLPVVYAGDYNSHEKHPLDGPAVAMAAAGATDTRNVAQHLTNAGFNSSNRYQRVPPAFGLAMDHIYVSPGVGVDAWGEVLNLDGSRFSGVIPSDHNPVWADLLVPR